MQANELKLLGKTQSTAMIVAQIVENFYTCLETLFLRISQFFENDLQKEKWHTDLLNKMTLKIDGVRERVIGEETHQNLLEILRFRRFKRYYFELNYDWEKMDFICAKFEKSHELLKSDLKDFENFLQKLLKQQI